jgi:hypothetical protein
MDFFCPGLQGSDHPPIFSAPEWIRPINAFPLRVMAGDEPGSGLQKLLSPEALKSYFCPAGAFLGVPFAIKYLISIRGH